MGLIVEYGSSDLSFHFVGSDVVGIDLFSGENLHLAAVDSSGGMWHTYGSDVSLIPVDLVSAVRQDINIAAPPVRISENLDGCPVLSSPAFDSRAFTGSVPEFDSPVMVYRRTLPDVVDPRMWSPMYRNDSELPNVEAVMSVPVVTQDGDSFLVTQDIRDVITLWSIEARHRSIVSSLPSGYRLYGASAIGNDIVILASKIDAAYPKESVSIQEFGGDAYSFFVNAPFVFVLESSESYQFFRSYSSSNETPFPSVSKQDLDRRWNSFDILPSGSIAVGSITYDAPSGTYRQSVAVCERGTGWSDMGGHPYPFDVDVAYDFRFGVAMHGYWKCPVAYSLAENGFSMSYFDYVSSTWLPWRQYKRLTLVGIKNLGP